MIKLTLWEGFAQRMQAYLDAKEPTIPVVVIIQQCRLTKYLGNVQYISLNDRNSIPKELDEVLVTFFFTVLTAQAKWDCPLPSLAQNCILMIISPKSLITQQG